MSNPTKTALQLAGVAVTMAALSFAAVPFYDWFCRTTGFAGTTSTASSAPDQILERTVRVRFDASIAEGMPWRFKPLQREMDVRIGEVGLAFYEASNPTDKRTAGTASYNVTPDSAGGYFTKIDCFCFEQQVLEPGETVKMPVTFFIDPEIVKDREGKYVREVTLSYTFHMTDLPADQAAAEQLVTGSVAN